MKWVLNREGLLLVKLSFKKMLLAAIILTIPLVAFAQSDEMVHIYGGGWDFFIDKYEASLDATGDHRDLYIRKVIITRKLFQGAVR